MSTYTETVGEKLNDLLEKTCDAQKGYRKASENTDDTNLKAFFLRKSNERAKFERELKSQIGLFGEEADKGSSVQGAAHRAWMDTKAFFSADSAEAMLEESIRGEKTAVKEYEEVLKETHLPHGTKTLLTQQMNTIKADLNQIKRLEDLR